MRKSCNLVNSISPFAICLDSKPWRVSNGCSNRRLFWRLIWRFWRAVASKTWIWFEFRASAIWSQNSVKLNHFKNRIGRLEFESTGFWRDWRSSTRQNLPSQNLGSKFSKVVPGSKEIFRLQMVSNSKEFQKISKRPCRPQNAFGTQWSFTKADLSTKEALNYKEALGF